MKNQEILTLNQFPGLGPVKIFKHDDDAIFITMNGGWLYAKYNVEDDCINFGFVEDRSKID